MSATSTIVSASAMTRRGLFRRLGRAQTVEAVRPPHAASDAEFLAACDRCGDCVAACASGIIVMSGGYPEVTFSHAGCDLCGDCARACPTAALDAARPAGAAWSHGIAIGDGCLSAQGVLCRVCGEHCEVGAIRFRPAVGGRSRPELDAAACTGCGACVAPCPAGAVAVTFA